MFTGIIEEVGTVTKLEQKEQILALTISAPKTASKLAPGDSIAIDGACFTTISTTTDAFTVEAIPETQQRTIIKNYREDTKVNLEPTLTLQKGISGHLVQGHVDGVGKAKAINEKQELEIEFPAELSKFIAFKGSITVNGVSLTVSKLMESSFQVSLIPFTLKETNLGKLTSGDEVNLEIDLIARYLEHMVQEKEGEAKYHFLRERNLI